MSKDKDLELRSPRMRRILDAVPPGLTVWAVVLSLLILGAVAAALCLLPYPHSGGESILEHILGGAEC